MRNYIYKTSVIIDSCYFQSAIIFFSFFQKCQNIVISNTEGVTATSAVKKRVLFFLILQNSQGGICVGFVFLINLQASSQQLYEKETPTQVFSCRFWKISKNNYLIEHKTGRLVLVAHFKKNIPYVTESKAWHCSKFFTCLFYIKLSIE